MGELIATILVTTVIVIAFLVCLVLSSYTLSMVIPSASMDAIVIGVSIFTGAVANKMV
jgi:hypothetical protein